MLIISYFRKKIYINDTYASLMFSLLIYALIEICILLIRSKKAKKPRIKPKNSPGLPSSKSNGLGVRGGDFDHRHAFDKYIVADGNYEITDKKFIQAFRDWMGCHKDRIIVSPGVLAAVLASLAVGNLILYLGPITLTVTNNSKVIIAKRIFAFLTPAVTLMFVKVPLIKQLRLLYFVLCFSLISPYEDPMIQQLPMYIETGQSSLIKYQYISDQYVSDIKEKLPKLIMRTANAPELYVSHKETVEDIVVKLLPTNNIPFIAGSKSKLLSSRTKDDQVSTQPKSLSVSQNAPGGSLIAHQKIKKNYIPLKQRTKTLADLEDKITKQEYDQAERWENPVKENLERSERLKISAENKKN